MSGGRALTQEPFQEGTFGERQVDASSDRLLCTLHDKRV